MKPANSFFKSTPRKSVVVFLLGVFLIFITTGFASDVMSMGRQVPANYVASILLIGIFAVLYAFWGFRLRNRFWKAFIPLCVLEIALLSGLSSSFPDRPQPVPMGGLDIAKLESRLRLDGLLTLAAIILGYSCFVHVSISEGRRYARVHAEMLLAAEIHRVLVPPIDTKLGSFEFCARSFPSGEVGGDLVDVFEHKESWIAYVADVSGHGVAPGVVMAMVKSAARMQLSSTEKSEALLGRLNEVLLPIKKPEMFVTFAYLSWNGQQLEYCTAGHPSILHYHAATEEISELECPNVPVGMFNGREFVTGTVTAASNDLFLILTDGVIEVANAKDEEFGLAGVKDIVSANASAPLPQILNAIVDATDRHGHAADDRSVLLARLTA